MSSRPVAANPASAGAHVHGAVVAGFVLLHLYLAMPHPRAISETDIQSAGRQEDLALWLGWIQQAHLPISKPQLESGVVAVSTTLGTAYDTLKKPFNPFLVFTGTGQGWGLFAIPQRWTNRLEIQVEEGAEWHTVYRRLQIEDFFLADTLKYRRVRGVYDGEAEKPKASYKNFTRWIARETFERYPEPTRIRVQTLREHTTLRGEAPDTVVEVRNPRPHKRENHDPNKPIAPWPPKPASAAPAAPAAPAPAVQTAPAVEPAPEAP